MKFVISTDTNQALEHNKTTQTIKSIKDTFDTNFGDIVVLDSRKVVYQDALVKIFPKDTNKLERFKLLQTDSYNSNEIYCFLESGPIFSKKWWMVVDEAFNSLKAHSFSVGSDVLSYGIGKKHIKEWCMFTRGIDLRKYENLSDTWVEFYEDHKFKHTSGYVGIVNQFSNEIIEDVSDEDDELKEDIIKKPIVKKNINSDYKDNIIVNNKSSLNKYFDEVYCINLASDTDRWSNMEKVFNHLNLEVTRWNATTDNLFIGYNRLLKDSNINPRYLACLNSHLSVMEDALNKGHDKVLILEDDIIPVKNFEKSFNIVSSQVPEIWDMLYLSYIRTTEDKKHWSYLTIEEELINDNLVVANNLWSGMAYGISKSLMKRTIAWYRNNYPIEIDRFFVDKIQKSELFYSFGSHPQLFAGVDNYSNNKQTDESIFARSINAKVQSKSSFVFYEDIPDTITPNEYFDEIFCINLLNSIDRWNRVSNQFDNVGIKVKRFDAVSSDSPKVQSLWEEIKNTKTEPVDLNVNERTLAAYYSHLDLIEHCINQGYENVLIFEDDVVFHKNFKHLFSKAVNNLPKETELWLLGGFQNNWSKTINLNESFYATSETLGLFAYALNKESMYKIHKELKGMIKNNWSVDFAMCFGLMSKHLLNTNVSYPMIVGHDTIESVTREEVFDFHYHFPKDDYTYTSKSK